MSCLVCNQPADSNEHYIPRWLSKATGQLNETLLRGAATDGIVTGVAEHGTSILAFEKNLCRVCNNGLGSVLENPVSAWLKPLVNGDADGIAKLTENQRSLIAWWAVLHV